jgi:pimeloyl-ACP methyl ester carboxylesterase
MNKIMLLLLAAAALLAAACGGRTTAQEVHHRLLAVADLPAGWTDTPTGPDNQVVAKAPCLAALPKHPQGWTYDVGAYVEGVATPTLVEVLATGAGVQEEWPKLRRAFASCTSATLRLGRATVQSSVRPLAFRGVAGTTGAFAWRFHLAGVEVDFDLVLFRTGRYAGYVAYSGLGPPPLPTVKAYVEAAIAKAAKGSTARVPDTVSVASTPVQTAATRRGTVGYRSLGSGPPVVLVTGYRGTMESWDPRFVDALAQTHRVVLLDNAGIGETAALPAPLTIDAMANQTSALIDALRLGRVDVLGWSMGTMVAQALAVLHPAQVRRLVLCAGFPGDGTNVRPAQSAIDALNSPAGAMRDLFPAGRKPAQSAYVGAVSGYGSQPSVPETVRAAQRSAVDAWWAGADPAGKRTAAIAAPTLVADGAADPLDPAANSRRLAQLLPHATLRLYPGAAHAFLFQAPSFAPLVQSFLR